MASKARQVPSPEDSLFPATASPKSTAPAPVSDPVGKVKNSASRLPSMPLPASGETQEGYVQRVQAWASANGLKGGNDEWEARALASYALQQVRTPATAVPVKRLSNVLPPSELRRTRDYLDRDVFVTDLRIVATDHGDSVIVTLQVNGETFDAWVNGEVVATKLQKAKDSFPVLARFTKKGKYYDVS